MCAQRVKASTTQMANVLTGTQRRVPFGTRTDQSESITKTVLTRELLNSQDSHTQRINDQIFNLSNHNIVELEYPEFQEIPLAKKVTQNTQENYPYTTDLIALEAHRPALPRQLPLLASSITSPLILDNWRQALCNHPDKQFVQYILQGLANGFHIGMALGHCCISSHDNMRSAKMNSQLVDDYLATELAAGRIVGPFEPHDLPTAQVKQIWSNPEDKSAGKMATYT